MATPNSEEGYNGYTNYETWAVCLWVSSDELLYECSQAIAKAAYKKGLDPIAQELPQNLQQSARVARAADALKEWLGNMKPDLPPSLWSDLLESAWREVNWDEVARVCLEFN